MFIAHFNDAIFVAKFIDFVVFLAAIIWLFNRYGKRALIAHQEAQNRIVADALTHRERSEAAVRAAREAIDRARVDAGRMIEVGEAQAARFIEAERASAKDHAARVIAHAAGELERERYRVRRQLLEETVESAHARAQEIAKKHIDTTAQRSLVERLIGHLERSRA